MNEATVGTGLAPVEAPQVPVAVERASVIEGLMEQALAKGPDGVASLRELVEMHREVAREDANRALIQAVAAFKAECPPILKTKAAGDVSDAGTSYGYMYADLPAIARTIDPVLVRHGLSYTWDSIPSEQGGGRVTTCTLWHVSGASRTSDADMPPVNIPKAGEVQKTGAALTYGQRYSLIMVLGLTTAVDDTDGTVVVSEPITDAQLVTLEEYLGQLPEERSVSVRAALLTWANEGRIDKLETLGELPANLYAGAADTLKTKVERASEAAS